MTALAALGTGLVIGVLLADAWHRDRAAREERRVAAIRRATDAARRP